MSAKFRKKHVGNKYGSMFDEIGDQDDMTGFEPSLPLGNHRVAVVKYGPKISKKDKKTTSLEAEVVILETANPKARVGARHSIFWNINGKGNFTADYAKDRAKKFLAAVAESVGNATDNTTLKAFGPQLAEDFEQDEPQLLGVELDTEVSEVFEKDGITPRQYAKGGNVTNVACYAVPGQDADSLEATRAKLIELAKNPQPASSPAAPATPLKTAVRAPAVETSSEPEAAPASPAASVAGKARSLLGARKAS